MPEIKFNGEAKKLGEGVSAEALLRQEGLVPDSLIVVLNGDVIELAALPSAVLKDGDSLDLLRLAGGG